MVKINMREGQNKLTLKAQVLSNFFAVGIIPLIVFVAITSIIVSSSMYNSQVSSLRQISSMAAKNVDKWGDDNSLLVEDIANSQIVKSNDLEGIQKELKNKQAQDTSISNIMYTDVNGNIIKDSKGPLTKVYNLRNILKV